MVKNVLNLLGLIAIALILPFTLGAQKASASDKLFAEKKCVKCHAVSAYNIDKKESDDDEDEDEDEDAKVEPPDLSNVGTFHDAAYLTQFLKKEVEHKPHAGNDAKKKHKSKFKGGDDELKQMVDWLVTLKKAPTE